MLTYETVELERHIDSVIEMQSQPVEANEWYVKEQEEPVSLPQSEQGKEDSWFVGDY